MRFELVANCVSLCEDGEAFVLAFGDDEAIAARYLMLQHALSPQEQDVQLGLDGLYIERDDQKHGCYFGVQAIRRIDHRIEIDLTERGVENYVRIRSLLRRPLGPLSLIADWQGWKICREISMRCTCMFNIDKDNRRRALRSASSHTWKFSR